mmetsp:Transcript_11871/g.39091  ORF Transcript_11871/g.39091 Transcript_11871/m.39091 type:complete len:242 (+) Transcript_11871:318-1043(+)
MDGTDCRPDAVGARSLRSPGRRGLSADGLGEDRRLPHPHRRRPSSRRRCCFSPTKKKQQRTRRAPEGKEKRKWRLGVGSDARTQKPAGPRGKEALRRGRPRSRPRRRRRDAPGRRRDRVRCSVVFVRGRRRSGQIAGRGDERRGGVGGRRDPRAEPGRLPGFVFRDPEHGSPRAGGSVPRVEPRRDHRGPSPRRRRPRPAPPLRRRRPPQALDGDGPRQGRPPHPALPRLRQGPTSRRGDR